MFGLGRPWRSLYPLVSSPNDGVVPVLAVRCERRKYAHNPADGHPLSAVPVIARIAAERQHAARGRETSAFEALSEAVGERGQLGDVRRLVAHRKVPWPR